MRGVLSATTKPTPKSRFDAGRNGITSSSSAAAVTNAESKDGADRREGEDAGDAATRGMSRDDAEIDEPMAMAEVTGAA